MIDLRELVQYEYMETPVRVVCDDGQVIIGLPDAVDDEEESGLGEPGITLATEDGGIVGIGISEIKAISPVAAAQKAVAI